MQKVQLIRFCLLLIFGVSFCTFVQAQDIRDSIIITEKFEILRFSKNEDSLQTVQRIEKLNALYQQNPDTVRKINLSNLGIYEFPDLQAFRKIRSIHLNKNKLQKICKSDWPEADSLRTIVLSNNRLKRVKFKKNASIKTLDLSENELTRIPCSIKHLDSLAFLDLSKNKIKRIPNFIKRMKNLKELKLNYNQLVKLNRRDIKKLKNLESIQLGDNQLTSLPENIHLLSKVKSLNLGINKLSVLPPTFAQLKTLEHLVFYRNEFDSLPPEIWELKNLKEIDFYHNHIRQIPEGIAQLDKLEQLYLAYNQLDRIPDTLMSLKNLKALYLHHNQIIMIPRSIVLLQEIQYLDLGYNRIFDFPDLSGMKHLLEIDLQENSLSEIPYELLENEHLRRIYLMGNPFVMTKEERAEMEKLREELLEIDIRLFF